MGHADSTREGPGWVTGKITNIIFFIAVSGCWRVLEWSRRDPYPHNAQEHLWGNDHCWQSYLLVWKDGRQMGAELDVFRQTLNWECSWELSSITSTKKIAGVFKLRVILLACESSYNLCLAKDKSSHYTYDDWRYGGAGRKELVINDVDYLTSVD